MPISPDTKDWTWVLERTCPECGFDVTAFPREQIGEMIRAKAAEWEALLQHPEVRSRPSEDRWSALEYGCHVRDVFGLYDQRLRMMLEDDDAHYENWDQDEASAGYAAEDPSGVIEEIKASAAALADRFDSVEGSDWDRTGTRSDGARFTVESFARYLIHDPVHHVHDVKQGYQRLAS